MLLCSTNQNIFTSKWTFYFFALILVLNQCLSAHSLRIYATDFDQNSVEENSRDYYPRWDWKPLLSAEDYPLDENNYSVVVEPTVQRRFCCMSPVGGRKRSIRSLSQEQQRKKSHSEQKE